MCCEETYGASGSSFHFNLGRYRYYSPEDKVDNPERYRPKSSPKGVPKLKQVALLDMVRSS